MSPFFDELEGQLRSAAETAAGARNDPHDRGPRRRRRWLPVRMDLAPVLASVVVVVVVGAALVLLGRGSRHQPTPPAAPPPHTGLAALIAKTPRKQLQREFAYIAAATRGVEASKACQVQQPTGVSFVHRTPDPQLLSLLGILRRPPTSADRLNREVFAGIPDVYAGSIRRSFSAGGESYYLAVSGFDRAASIPSDRCLALQTQALADYLPKIPPALRTATVELQTGYIAWARNLYTRGPRDGICLLGIGRNETGSMCGITAAEIKAGMSPSNDQGVFSGIVPDGVAKVTLSFPAADGRPPRSVTGPVLGNVYAIHVPGAPQNPPQPAVTWRSPNGHVIKTIPAPTAAMQRAACQKQPITCALIQDGGMSESSTSSSGTATATAAPPPKH